MRDPIRRLVVENVDPRPGRGGWHGGPTAAGALRGVSAEDASWRADALLKSEQRRLVAAVASVPLRRYGEVLPGGKQWTVGELILGVAQHDAYHVGQIQMLKRLRVGRRPGR